MSTTIPAVLSALADKLATVLPPNFQVAEATLLDQENDFLIVGYEDGEAPAVQGTRDMQDLGGDSDSEAYDITNLLSVWVGDADDVSLRDARVKLAGYLDTIAAAFKTDPTVGVDAVEQVRVTEFAFQQEISGKGFAATLRFLVHVDAWS